MLSKSKNRADEKMRYSSAKAMAEKAEAGYQATYLRLPKGVKLYKPKVGKSLLDILPFEAQEGNPNAEAGMLHWERTFWTHRGIGPNQETFICPAKTVGKKCPICEHRVKLMSSEDDGDEKLRKELAPKQRQLIALKDLKEPDKGIQVSEMSSFCFGDEILSSIQNADEGEDWDLFFTLDKGLTLRVLWIEDSFGGHKFIKADRIDFKERADSYDDDILEDVPALDEMLLVLSYKDLEAKFMAEEEKEKEEKEDEPRGKRSRDDDDEPRGKKDDDDEPRGKRSREDDDEPTGRKSKDEREGDDDGKEPDWEDFDDENEGKKKDDDDEPRGRRSRDEDEPRGKRSRDDDDEPRGKRSKRED